MVKVLAVNAVCSAMAKLLLQGWAGKTRNLRSKRYRNRPCRHPDHHRAPYRPWCESEPRFPQRLVTIWRSVMSIDTPRSRSGLPCSGSSSMRPRVRIERTACCCSTPRDIRVQQRCPFRNDESTAWRGGSRSSGCRVWTNRWRSTGRTPPTSKQSPALRGDRGLVECSVSHIQNRS